MVCGQGRVQPVFGYQLVPLLVQRGPGLFACLGLYIEQFDKAARLRGDLGNAASHGTSANNANGFVKGFHGNGLLRRAWTYGSCQILRDAEKLRAAENPVRSLQGQAPKNQQACGGDGAQRLT